MCHSIRVQDKPALRRFRTRELVQVAIVLAAWTAGIVLRFRAAPASYLGGGLLILGCVLLAYWAKTSAKR